MLLADLHAVPPASVPEGSVVGWLLLAILVVAVVTAGMFLSARR
jgi:hypothetical protein